MQSHLTLTTIDAFEQAAYPPAQLAAFNKARALIIDPRSNTETQIKSLRLMNSLCIGGFAPAQVFYGKIYANLGHHDRAHYLFHCASNQRHPEALLRMHLASLSAACSPTIFSGFDGRPVLFENHLGLKILESFWEKEKNVSPEHRPEVVERMAALFAQNQDLMLPMGPVHSLPSGAQIPQVPTATHDDVIERESTPTTPANENQINESDDTSPRFARSVRTEEIKKQAPGSSEEELAGSDVVVSNENLLSSSDASSPSMAERTVAEQQGENAQALKSDSPRDLKANAEKNDSEAGEATGKALPENEDDEASREIRSILELNKLTDYLDTHSGELSEVEFLKITESDFYRDLHDHIKKSFDHLHAWIVLHCGKGEQESKRKATSQDKWLKDRLYEARDLLELAQNADEKKCALTLCREFCERYKSILQDSDMVIFLNKEKSLHPVLNGLFTQATSLKVLTEFAAINAHGEPHPKALSLLVKKAVSQKNIWTVTSCLKKAVNSSLTGLLSNCQKTLESFLKNRLDHNAYYWYGKYLYKHGDTRCRNYFSLVVAQFPPAWWMLQLSALEEASGDLKEQAYESIMAKGPQYTDGKDETKQVVAVVVQALEELAPHDGAAAFVLSKLFMQKCTHYPAPDVAKAHAYLMKSVELEYYPAISEHVITTLTSVVDKQSSDEQLVTITGFISKIFVRKDERTIRHFQELVRKGMQEGAFSLEASYALADGLFDHDRGLALELINYAEALIPHLKGKKKLTSYKKIVDNGLFNKLCAKAYVYNDVAPVVITLLTNRLGIVTPCFADDDEHMSRSHELLFTLSDFAGSFLKKESKLRNAIWLQKVHYLLKKEEFGETTEVVKRWKEEGDEHATSLYGQILLVPNNPKKNESVGIACLLKVIEDGGTYAQESSQLLKKYLTTKLNETSGTPEMCYYRDALLQIMRWAGEDCTTIENNPTYYTQEELRSRFKAACERDDQVGLAARGIAHSKQGNYEEARQCYTQALALGASPQVLILKIGLYGKFSQETEVEDRLREDMNALIALISNNKLHFVSDEGYAKLLYTTLEELFEVFPVYARYLSAYFCLVCFDVTQDQSWLTRVYEYTLEAELRFIKLKESSRADSPLVQAYMRNEAEKIVSSGLLQKLETYKEDELVVKLLAEIHRGRFLAGLPFEKTLHDHAQKAVECFKRAMQGGSQETDEVKAKLFDLYINLALKYCESNEHHKAKDVLNKAIELKVNEGVGYCKRAELYIRHGLDLYKNPSRKITRKVLALAMADFENACKNGSSEALYQLALMKYNGYTFGSEQIKKDLPAALRMLEELTVQHKHPQAAFILGSTYYDTRNYQLALHHWQQCDLPEGQLGKIACYYVIARAQKNVEYVAKAVETLQKLNDTPDLSPRHQAVIEMIFARFYLEGFGFAKSLSDGLSHMEKSLRIEKKPSVSFFNNPQALMKLLDAYGDLPLVKYYIGWITYKNLLNTEGTDVFKTQCNMRAAKFLEIALPDLDEERSSRCRLMLSRLYFEQAKILSEASQVTKDISKESINNFKAPIKKCFTHLVLAIKSGFQNKVAKYEFFTEMYEHVLIQLVILGSKSPLHSEYLQNTANLIVDAFGKRN